MADQRALDALIAALGKWKTLSVDTESNSLYAYRERVCLIQFSVPGRDYIVDPLAISELDALGAIFADAAIEKIFHAAEYDLIVLHRDFGWDVQNIFDTMIAARTLGWKRVGLASILQDEFGVKLNKRLQRANWGARPLTPDHLAYARLDTHYLLQLRDRLQEDLQANGRLEEACEEFDRIRRTSLRNAMDNRPNGPDPAGYWRISGVRDLTSRQVAILRELYLYRERTAQDWNRPAFKVIGDETLVAVARHGPRALKDLATIVGMTPSQIRRHGRPLLDAVHAGRKSKPPRPPAAQRVDEAIMQRYEALRGWRKNRARKRGVESDVILAREVLWDLAHKNPTTEAELDLIADLGPWRREHYGSEIIAVLQETT